MSIQAMAWVIDYSQQTGLGFVTLLMIANHANAEGRKSFPSMKTLAKECRLSVRTIQRTILKLEASGELTVDRSSGRASHNYSLPLMPNLDIESTLPKQKPARQRRQQESTLNAPNVDTQSMFERGHSVHVEAQRGQGTYPNVDSVGLNVDSAESTEPYNRKKNHKELSPHSRLMEFLQTKNGAINGGKEGKAAREILKHYTAEQAEACYLHLAGEQWRTTAVTWTTVLTQIGTYLKRLDDPVRRTSPDAPFGYDKMGRKILSDDGKCYTFMGEDGTPTKRWHSFEAFATERGIDPVTQKRIGRTEGNGTHR